MTNTERTTRNTRQRAEMIGPNGIGLSPEVEAGMEKTIGAVVEQLRHFGYEVKSNGIKSEY